jgi:hypothetical protein
MACVALLVVDLELDSLHNRITSAALTVLIAANTKSPFLAPTTALAVARIAAGLAFLVTATRVFDHLILRMQLAMLRAETDFVKMAEKVVALAALLETKSTIPMVAAQLPVPRRDAARWLLAARHPGLAGRHSSALAFFGEAHRTDRSTCCGYGLPG